MKTDLQIVMRPLKALIPYARNARTHSTTQVAQIAASIKEFGWTQPVLIDGDNGIVAGHGRVMAAETLGIETVPCIELKHLTEAQKRAYVIADNKIALNSDWDMDVLSAELNDLKALEFPIDLTGFFDGNVASMTAQVEKMASQAEPQLAAGLTFSVIVEVADEAAQAGLLERLEKEGFKCRLLMS